MRHHARPVRVVLLAIVWLLPSVASAQGLSGQIVGVVTDPTGAVIPGVSVTAEGPALIQPQTVTTTPDGGYRFPSLPPGEYSVTFALDGLKSVRREGIKLTLQTVLKIDASLTTATLAQDITVVGQAPIVDVGSTAVGTSFNKELLTDIPTARDIWTAMALAPGLQMRGIDVGGSRTGTQTGFTAYGVDTGHRTLVEGIIVNNSRTSNSGYFDYGSFEEIRIGASGAMGESAGPGALLNFAVKSGGDTFHGDVWADYQNRNLVSNNVPAAFKTSGGVDEDGFVAPAGGVQIGNRITSKYDVNGGLGGRIVRHSCGSSGVAATPTSTAHRSACRTSRIRAIYRT